MAVGDVTVGPALGAVVTVENPLSGIILKVDNTASNYGSSDPVAYVKQSGDVSHSSAVGVFGVGNSDDSGNDGNLFRVTQLGYVGIGTTTPDRRLTVVGDRAAEFVGYFKNDGNNANRHGIRMDCGAYADGVGQCLYLFCRDGNGANNKGYIEESAGGVFQLVNVSARSVKKDIEDTKVDGVATVKALRLREYRKQSAPPDSKKVECGFVAEEAEAAYPDMVSEHEGTKGTAIAAIVPVLAKALQEIVARVEALEGA